MVMSKRWEEGEINHHGICVILSRHVNTHTHYVLQCRPHLYLSDVVDLVGLSLSVSYHVAVYPTLDHRQG